MIRHSVENYPPLDLRFKVYKSHVVVEEHRAYGFGADEMAGGGSLCWRRTILNRPSVLASCCPWPVFSVPAGDSTLYPLCR